MAVVPMDGRGAATADIERTPRADMLSRRAFRRRVETTMDHLEQSQSAPTDVAARRFAEQPADADAGKSADPTLIPLTHAIEVVEEDRGSDPYNHTGRFKRNIR
jgi:hypothetical protein